MYPNTLTERGVIDIRYPREIRIKSVVLRDFQVNAVTVLVSDNAVLNSPKKTSRKTSPRGSSGGKASPTINIRSL